MISSLRQLATEPDLLFPKNYLVITENAAIVKQQYTVLNQDAFAELSSLPTYPDEKGIVVLLNAMGKIIDELLYDEKWHFKLIDNNEGVALERINYNNPTQEARNWHSAATSAGYGTPGYQNSQYKTVEQFEGIIQISPEIFSPDNNGFDDLATISYQFTEPGFVCNITVFDANGRPVRFLTRNAICGLKGYYRWDGLDEQNNKLPIGVYVLLTEVFNLRGKTKKYKNAIVLARQLR